MRFDLRHPCVDCPFLVAREFHLAPARVAEIERAVVRDQRTFSCHKTVEFDDEGEPVRDNPKEQHCAGVLILLERMGRPNQLMRIAERVGLYNSMQLDLTANIFSSFRAMRLAMKERETPRSHHA